MNKKLLLKLESLHDRHAEIATLMAEGEVISNNFLFKKLAKEYAELEPIISSYSEYLSLESELQDTQSYLNDSDKDMQALAEAELLGLKAKQKRLVIHLQTLMLPTDPNDAKDVFIEIRAGTGGAEASLFVNDLLKMYLRFADAQRWHTEIINMRDSDQGGYKEVIVLVKGIKVYSKLKFESGAHRVQRVPETESQGRVHTSACTVVVLSQADDLNEIAIDKKDLRIDTFRSSGAGGQHVNKTDSAIRITHIPTGIVVECQDERSQHKNRARAMSVLSAKILDIQQQKQHQEESSVRKDLVGSGDRSERIRTYNFPQGRVTDHRIHLTLYKLNEVLQGHLDAIIMPLLHEYHLNQLAKLD